MTLIMNFQGQIFRTLYPMNGVAGWHGTKGMWVNRMLGPLCELELTLSLVFQGHIFKKPLPKNGMADWHGTNGTWVNRMSDPFCDVELWPSPWLWPWIFKVKFWTVRISGMSVSIYMEWKGCDSIRCWTYYWPRVMTLTQVFMIKFQKAI